VRASARGAAAADTSAIGLAGAEMLMLGSATTDAELVAETRGNVELAEVAGALAGFELAPNAKAESAPGMAAAGTFSAGGGRLDENAAGSGGAIDPCGGVESNRSLKTS
jgi:hypothetical protein